MTINMCIKSSVDHCIKPERKSANMQRGNFQETTHCKTKYFIYIITLSKQESRIPSVLLCVAEEATRTSQYISVCYATTVDA